MYVGLKYIGDQHLLSCWETWFLEPFRAVGLPNQLLIGGGHQDFAGYTQVLASNGRALSSSASIFVFFIFVF